MGSGIEERIRELLVSELRTAVLESTPRIELSGVTLELRVERMVVVLGQSSEER